MTGRAHLAAAASVLALLAAAGLFIARLALGSPLAPDSVERIVIVEAGDSFGAVASNLAESEIVERPGLFKLAAFLRGAAGRIQAGEYRIRFGDTHRALLERMMRGEVVQHYFTIVEGWTVSELLRALSAEDLLAQTLKSSNPEELACEMNLGYAHAEGLFFPDTYAYTRERPTPKCCCAPTP